MSKAKLEVRQKWAKPTPQQRLSHRSILQFVELADQLARDLCTILLPEWKQDQDATTPLGVYFVSVDRHSQVEPKKAAPNSPQVRYYNLRLLKTFRFTDHPDEQKPIKPAWDWVKDNYKEFEPLFQCADYLEEHSRDHFKMWAQCIEAARALDALDTPAEKEEIAQLERQKKEIAEKAHDLLVEAIAAMPYTGLLPSALDHWFYAANWECKATDPVRFSVKYELGKVFFPSFLPRRKKINLIKEYRNLIPHEAFPKLPKNHTDSESKMETQWDLLGKLYIKDFINWFTLGLIPSAGAVEGDIALYDQNSKDINGFALPIHHFFDRAGKQVGGFEGWVVVHDADGGNKHYKQAFTNLKPHKNSVTLALRSFSRRIREERMRELIEKEWLTTSDCRSFTLHHFQEFDGWVPENREVLELQRPEKHWQFAFLAEKKEEDVPEDNAPSIRFTLYDQLGADSTREQAPIKITHIAVYPPARRDGTSEPEKPLLFRKREDTILPTNHQDLVDYGFHITQSVWQIYNASRLKENAAQDAAQAATDILSDDFAHQIQHVAVALSTRWLISQDSYRSLTNGSIEERKAIVDYKIAPVPCLFQHVEAVLSLWSAKKASAMTWGAPELIGNRLRLSEACKTAAKYAASELIAFELKSRTLNRSESIKDTLKILEKANILQNTCNFTALDNSFVFGQSESADDFLISIVRLFEALIFNAFLHAGAPIEASQVDRGETLCVSFTNKLGSSRHNGGDGERTIQRLARHLSFSIDNGRMEDGAYKRVIQIPSKKRTAIL